MSSIDTEAVKKKLLEDLRKDRPTQVIHEVKSFKKNKHGFYDVVVDMQVESDFLGATIKHVHTTLPYPFSDYEKLSEGEQFNWRWENH